ncbi:hypothetical protein FRC17_011223 [Serendipita sp. 399]|nr:hypothetical protein FRC17_011223 [Serendipita sp. 399]
MSLYSFSELIMGEVRFNALSRNLEQALQKEGIPSRVLAGQKFFERIEVKDLLAYLQLIDNPDFDPAILRIINVPKRNIGNKSIEELQKRARGKKQPVMQIVERIVDGRIPDVSPPLQGKAKRLVHSLRKLRRLAREGMPVHTLIQELVTELNYADHLMKTQPDWETRWENVRELITFATEPNSNGGPGTEAPSAAPDTEPVIIEEGEEFSVPVTPATEPEQFLGEPKTVFKATKGATSEESELAEGIDEAAGYDVQIITPLRHFLQTTSLSTDATVNDDESQGEKVVISTCHAAKGLEWPVVFIPSGKKLPSVEIRVTNMSLVEQGTFPFYRSDDVEEERRLLYVACTRAQIMLYLTHANKRKLGGESKATGLSDYLKDVLKKGPKGTFADTRPTVGYKEFSVLCKVIERDAPDPKAVEEGVRSYCKSRPQTTQPTSSAPVSYPSSGSAYRIPVGHQSQTVVHSAVFSTARAVVGTLPQVQVIGTSRTTSSTPLVRPSEQQPTSFTTIPTRKQHPTFVPNPVSSSSSSHKPESVRESVQKEGVLHAETTKYRFKKPMGSEGTPSASGTATQGVLSRNGVNGLGEVPAVSASVRVSISTHGSSAVVQSAVPRPEEVPPKVVGTKRRLGMTARVSKFPRNV